MWSLTPVPPRLPKQTLVFDGTVSAINGDKVTFTVNQAYRGADGAGITPTPYPGAVHAPFALVLALLAQHQPVGRLADRFVPLPVWDA